MSEKVSNDNAKKRTATYFDDLSDGYENSYAKADTPSSYFFLKRQEIVLRAIKKKDAGCLVDIGCAAGPYAELALKIGYRYCGVDISERMIKNARERLHSKEGVKFWVGDAKSLPFPTGSVDTLLCLGMLEYVPYDERKLYLLEMARVVRPGGVLVFSFLNGFSFYWFFIDAILPATIWIKTNLMAIFNGSKLVSLMDCRARVEELYTRKFYTTHLTALLREIGLTLDTTQYFSANILPPPFGNRLRMRSVWISSKLEPLLRFKIFSWLAMGFIIVANKTEMPKSD